MAKNFFSKGSTKFLVILLVLISVMVSAGTVYAILATNKISGEMVEGGDVWLEYLISPDGQYTVFLADALTDDRTELFSVRTLGGERILLSQGLPADCHVNSLWLSPDSQHVVYSAIDSSFHHCGLYTVPINGGEPIVLDSANDNYSAVWGEVTGDNEKVVFVLRTSTSPYQSRLYYVPIEGGIRQAISDVVDATIHFSIDPNSDFVIYLQISSSESDKLYKNNFDDFNILLDQDDSLSDFQITVDGLYVVYRKTTVFGIELFSIPIGGGTPERLTESTHTDMTVNRDYKISPDSVYVVYRSDQEVHDEIKLYQVPVDGGTSPVPLTPVLIPNGDVVNFDIIATKLGDLFYGVVYMADQLSDECIDLFSVRIDGIGPIVHLSRGMAISGDVEEFKITPKSLGVVYIADGHVDDVKELYFVDIFGSTFPVKINDPLTPGGNVTYFNISHNGRFVIYHADQDVDEEHNLYAYLSSTGTVTRLNPDMVLDGDVFPFNLITPDDKGVVYLADQETDDVMELFVAYDYQMVYLPLVIK